VPAWSKGLVLFSLACTNAGGNSGSEETEEPEEDSPSSIEVGGFSLQGVIRDVYTWTQTGAGLCLSAADSLPLARGESLVPSSTAVVESDGSWLLEDVPVAGTTGILLLLDDCEGQGGLFPTASIVLPEVWAGKGPEDIINGIEAYHLGESRLQQWEEELAASGNTEPISDYGAFMGHIEGEEGEALASTYVQSSEDPTPYYDQGEGDWVHFSGGTTTEGSARFIMPSATWGNYIAKGPGTDFMPLVLGGLPEYVIYHRWEAQISDYGEEE
jgi:hypothetical protein